MSDVQGHGQDRAGGRDAGAFRRSPADPEDFRGEAAPAIDWYREPAVVLDTSHPPLSRWFARGPGAAAAPPAAGTPPAPGAGRTVLAGSPCGPEDNKVQTMSARQPARRPALREGARRIAASARGPAAPQTGPAAAGAAVPLAGPADHGPGRAAGSPAPRSAGCDAGPAGREPPAAGDAAGAGPGPGRVARPLTPEDLSILALENQTVAGHTCLVMVLRGTLGLDPLRSSIAARLHRAPDLGLRLGQIGGEPWWVPDPQLNLNAHVVQPDQAGACDQAGFTATVARIFEQRLV